MVLFHKQGEGVSVLLLDFDYTIDITNGNILIINYLWTFLIVHNISNLIVIVEVQWAFSISSGFWSLYKQL